MRARHAWVVAGALYFSCTTRAEAQQPSRVRVTVTPYAWVAGLKGHVGVGPLETKVDQSVRELLKELEFGAMGTVEARYGHWFVASDAMYVSIGNSRVVAVRGDTGNFSLTQKETMLQPVAGYALSGPTWNVDLMAGARYWHLSVDLDVERPSGTSRSRSGSQSWADATGGARARWTPGFGVWMTGGGDAGGGGSHSTWQAYGSLGKDVAKYWNAAVGYRYLAVDYHNDRFLCDVNTRGFTFNVSYRF